MKDFPILYIGVIACLLIGGSVVARIVYYSQNPTEIPNTSVNVAGGDGTVGVLDQWKSDGTNITQRTASKPIKITGLSDGCLALSSSILTSSGSPCGSGGGGASFGKSWELTLDHYNVLALSPTTTVPVNLRSTATSSFSGGIESYKILSAPFVHATNTQATSTFDGGIKINASRTGFGSTDVVPPISTRTYEFSGFVETNRPCALFRSHAPLPEHT